MLLIFGGDRRTCIPDRDAIPQAAGFFAEKFPTGGITVDWLVGACVAYATGLLTLFDKAMETPAWTGPTALQWFGGGFLRFWPLAFTPAV